MPRSLRSRRPSSSPRTCEPSRAGPQTCRVPSPAVPAGSSDLASATAVPVKRRNQRLGPDPELPGDPNDRSHSRPGRPPRSSTAARRPAKAVVGETFEVTATVFREGHDAVAANVVLRDPSGRLRPLDAHARARARHRPLGRRGHPDGRGPLDVHRRGVERPGGHLAAHRRRSRSRPGSTPSWCSPRAPSCYERAAAGVPKRRRPGGRARPPWTRCATRPRPPPPGSPPPWPRRWTPRSPATRCANWSPPRAPLPLLVERERALFGSWYELFPRSEGAVVEPGRAAGQRHASAPPPSGCPASPRWASTWSTCRRSTRSAPPSARARTTPCPPGPDDVGVALGDRLRRGRPRRGPPGPRHHRGLRRTSWHAPATCGLEVALDFALQCSPDHPWVEKHPEWFHHRADGTIAYAENPPKKYQDIYPIDFDTDMRRPGRRRPCGSCGTGWRTACGSSGSTTRTPSRSSSGRR